MTDTADTVQDFYERYPYPPAVEGLDQYRSLWEDGQLRRQDHHLFWPARPFRDDHSILVAGCGTSQAAKYAIRWPHAQVTGIDVSAASVRCTEELKRKYDLENLELHQLPVERAAELGQQFDQVVCTGVLHHLADPGVGLGALREALKPDGALHLMVYAPYGRVGIYMMQEYCRRVGISATDEGINALVATLGAMPSAHPLGRLKDAPDFGHPASIADALLHPHDRAYSVPALFELLASGGFAFDRWMRQAQYSPRCGFAAHACRSAGMEQLAAAEQFAAVELLRGTMVRHSLIARRDDCPESGHAIHFDGDTWLSYVPIRTSETLSVRERLPAGAASVAINRGHSFTDIVLPLDEKQTGWLDAIDGARTAGEIVWSAIALGEARDFFEQLWWHDQIVFDASRMAST